MNRRIIFRGYNLKNKKWLYGYYLVNRGKSYIVQDEVVDPFAVPEDFEVDPESVGQFIGTYKGQNVFEGDNVEVTSKEDKYMHDCGTVRFDDVGCKYIVDFNKPFGITDVPFTGDKQKASLGMGASYEFYYDYKVISNEYEERLKISNP